MKYTHPSEKANLFVFPEREYIPVMCVKFSKMGKLLTERSELNEPCRLRRERSERWAKKQGELTERSELNEPCRLRRERSERWAKKQGELITNYELRITNFSYLCD